MKYFLYHKSRKKGFTLIEMIVSVAIFIVVATVAVGALLKIVDANRKAQSVKASINNIHYVLDTMSRELRMGTRYKCANSFSFTPVSGGSYNLLTPDDCNFSTFPVSSSWYLAFHSSKQFPKASGGGYCNLVYFYRFRFNASGKFDGIIKGSQPNCESTVWNDFFVTSPDVVVSEMNLYVTDDTTGGTKTPRVFIHMKGYAGVKERNRTPFDAQTTISQRIPN